MINTRMSTSAYSEGIIKNIYANRNTLTKMQEQLSSNSQISTMSDNPTDAMEILKVDSSLTNISAYLNNISAASGELDLADTTLSSLTTLVQDASDIATQASSSATYNHDNLVALKAKLDQIIQSVKELGNTKYKDTYIFAGQNTNTAPFSDSSTGVGVVYNGSLSTEDYQRKVTVSDGVSETINVAGDTIFGSYSYDETTDTETGSGLMKSLCQLSRMLDADPPDYDSIRSQIDELDSASSTVIEQRAKLGAINSRLTITETQLSTQKTNLTAKRKELKEPDLVELISDMTAQETTLQASLQVTSSIMGLSMLNYL